MLPYARTSETETGAGAARSNLPVLRSPIVGREAELAATQDILLRDQVGLLTFTGPGGVGKTRLALQVASHLLDRFAHGVSFVNFAPISDPALVIPTIAETLGIKESRGQPLIERLKNYLRDKQMLLVLDNFEQVVEAATDVTELLSACPDLKVLVTSRELLQVYGEHSYPVPPLSLPPSPSSPSPPAPNKSSDLDAFSGYEAIELFVQRAQAVSPGFQLTDRNAYAVAEICLRLDGLPLAIELAAAGILVLSPEELLARLTSRLSLPAGGARDLPERQRTLQAAIDWSYNLLGVNEQTLFRRLGVFVGGCTLKAIEEVCAGDVGTDILEGVTSLVGKSLLQRQEPAPGEHGFYMLETIREYAGHKLDQSGETAQLREHHAQYYLRLVEEAERYIPGPHSDTWLKRLDEEQNNLRAALEWSIASDDTTDTTQGRRTETGLRLVGALSRYWNSKGYFSEGRQWCLQLLSKTDPRPPGAEASAERARALRTLAHMTWQLGDVSEARRLFENSLEMSRALGDNRDIAAALQGLGTATMWQGENELSRSLYDEALAIGREVGDSYIIANSLSMIGVILMRTQEYQAARPLMDEALALARELGDEELKADTLVKMGSLAVHLGEYERASRVIEEGLGIARELGQDRIVALSLARLGVIALRRNQAHEAETLFLEGLARAGSSGIKRWSPWYMVGLAEVARLRGMCERAAKLIGASEGVLSAVAVHYEPATRDEIARIITSVSAELDDMTFGMLRAEGRAMTLEEAMAYATQPHSNAPSAEQAGTAGGSGTSTPLPVHERIDAGALAHTLTSREVEVLALIAQGKSNLEIGQELVLSRRTVERHISNIYQKIGASGKVARATATAFALRHGITP